MRVPVLKATRESIRFGFAVGKVRVLETKVFGQATYERLLDAADFAEQRRILSDTSYGRYLDGAETAADVERGLDRALDDFYGFLDEASLPRPVVRFFRERYDYANLKGVLKARLLDTPAEGLLVDLGTIPVEHFGGALEELPEPLGSLAGEVLDTVRSLRSEAEAMPRAGAAAGGSQPQVNIARTIDNEIDRAMFVELALLARESKSSFLRDLAELQIDIANVKSLLRARLAGIPEPEAIEMALKGGSIRKKELAELYEMPVADVGERLAALPLLSGISPAEFADLSRLDVLSDNLVVEYLRRARLVPIGAEPVIAYVTGREAEVRAVRTLLIGKLARLPREVLRVRLRNLYV